MFSGGTQAYGRTTKPSALKTAQEPLKYFYAAGFDKDTTPDDVMLHMKYNDTNFKYFERLPPRGGREVTRSSFKMRIRISLFRNKKRSDLIITINI